MIAAKCTMFQSDKTFQKCMASFQRDIFETAIDTIF